MCEVHGGGGERFHALNVSKGVEQEGRTQREKFIDIDSDAAGQTPPGRDYPSL